MAEAERSPYNNPDVESSVQRIEELFGKAYRELRQELLEQLAGLDRDEQQLVSTTANVQRVRALAAKMRERMAELGWSDVIEAQAQELEGLAHLVLKEADSHGLPSSFSATTGQSLDTVLWNAHQELLGDQAQVASQLETLIVRSVVGDNRWMDVVAKLEDRLRITQRQAMTKAADTIASFHNLTRTQHFGEAGVEWWLYDGPEGDDVIRDFCQHFVGKRVTLDLLNLYADHFGRKHPLPPAVSLGGYNCRHELIPLVTQQAIDEHEIGDPLGLLAAA